MAFKTSYFTVIAAFLIFLMPFSSCTKTESGSSSTIVKTDENRPAVTGNRTSAVENQEQNKNSDSVPAPQTENLDKASVSEPGGNDFLLFFSKEPVTVLAEDYEIGELLYSESPNADERAVYSAVSSYLTAILNNESTSEMLINEKAEFINVNIEDAGVAAKYSSFRIGFPDFTAEPVYASVRLFGESFTATGEIYLENRGGWKIYDFQIHSEEKGFEKKSDSYEPVEYGINKKRF